MHPSPRLAGAVLRHPIRTDQARVQDSAAPHPKANRTAFQEVPSGPRHIFGKRHACS
ncbi:hypothetical protein [Streptomyces sp. NPDC058613]|uniref:hypothetical protein n=1 Tax=Streptomyces sp. NPDC058613 TaxID=3346556 RepID=UPI003663BC35